MHYSLQFPQSTVCPSTARRLRARDAWPKWVVVASWHTSINLFTPCYILFWAYVGLVYMRGSQKSQVELSVLRCPAVSCGVLWHSTSVFGVSELSNRSSSVSTNSKMSTEASSLLCDALDKSIDKSANPDNCDGVRMALRQRALEPSVGCSWCTAGRVQALGCNILGANASPVAMYDSKAYGLTRLLGMWWSPLAGEKCFTS